MTIPLNNRQLYIKLSYTARRTTECLQNAKRKTGIVFNEQQCKLMNGFMLEIIPYIVQLSLR